MTLSKMDYWRLSDELSVVDASLLVVGLNPGEVSLEDADIATSRLVKERVYGAGRSIDEADFRAVFKSMRSAIIGNNLRANLAFSARSPAYQTFSYEGEYRSEKIPADDNENVVNFDQLFKLADHGPRLFADKKLDLASARELYILSEPNWHETTVSVNELKIWLASRGLAPDFFFPKGNPEGFRDKSHVRYSPKLACAIAAWEAVKGSKKNMSVKMTVEEWVKANAVTFGMVGTDGVPSNQAVEQVAAVVNWATGGGANRTGEDQLDELEAPNKEVQNFSDVTSDFDRDIDSDIPF